MKINSPEDIVSAYATMRLLEPICHRAGAHIEMLVMHASIIFNVTHFAGCKIAQTGDGLKFHFVQSLAFITRDEVMDLIAKLNAAMAPEQNENQ